MADPTSWYAIEAGWEVVDADGAPLGSVVAVVGDEDADIFDGLRFEGEADGEESYVPGDRVGEIVEGRVTVLPGGEGARPPGGAEFERDRDAEL
jgi:hypothetical protein